MSIGAAARRMLASLLLVAAAASAGDEARLGPVREIASGVYVVSGSSESAHPGNGGAVGNLGFIATPAGSVVINAGGTYGLGQVLIALAERHTGKPAIAAVITQARPEFVMGMAAFEERGIELIAHEATARLIARRCIECLHRLRRDLGDEAMRGTRLAAPTRLLSSDERIAPGGRRIDLLHLGAGQTEGDLVVLDVDSGVVFAGALVTERRVPELEHAGGARPWRAVLGRLRGLGARMLVPGYGSHGSPEALISATDGYLARLVDEVQARWDTGADLMSVNREVAMPAWRVWAQYEPLHARNVQRQFLAAEAQWMSQPK
jgi:glyoxylase-like metal-dependent hydrolase (beta-lactamase superfamily II)